MSLRNGSASSTERTIQCPSWLALPQVHRSNPYADRGHAIHGYQRAVLAGVNDAQALAAVPPEHRETCRLIDWRKLCGDLEGIEVEVAYAIDVRARTARVLGTNIGRDYEGAAARAGQPLGEWEVPGSLDITGRRRVDPLRVVIDTKSGFQGVTAVEDNGQGLFFASVFHLLEGAEQVMVRMAKMKPSGDVWNDVTTFGAWKVDEYLDTLEDALERSKESRRVYLAGGTPEVMTGSHCTYCSSMSACPAYTGLARAMVPTLSEIDGRIQEMTVSQCGSAWRTAKRAESILDRVFDSLKARAKTEPLPVDAEHEVRASTYEHKRFHQGEALKLLESLGATEAQVASLYKTATVTKVQEAKTRTVDRRRP